MIFCIIKEDLLVILTISPHSYIINQSNILQKKEIIITINNQWPSSNNMLNRYHVPIEARINEFRFIYFHYNFLK